MRSAFRAAAVFVSLGTVLFAADDGKQTAKPPVVREESMAADRFAEAHAPLFRPPKANEAGALTEQLAPSEAAAIAADSLPLRNFIDQKIFGKMRRDGVPHAPLSSDYEFLRRVIVGSHRPYSLARRSACFRRRSRIPASGTS